MEKQYKNRFFAWLFDAFILECVLLPLRTFLLKNTDLLSYAGLSVLLGLFILTILYHVRWTHKTPWISPGETMIGVKLKEGNKVQTNPFPISRIVLIILIVFDLVSTARTLDTSTISYFGRSEMIFIWSFGTIYNAILLYGIWMVGQAKEKGLIFISLAYLLMSGAYFTNTAYFNKPATFSPMWASIFFLIANLLVGGYYFYRLRKASVA